MPISGPALHQQLMDAYATVQSRLESARGQSSQVRQQRATLDEARSEALVSLAEHYLPELTRDAIRQTWFEVRPTVSQVLVRKEEHSLRVHRTVDDLTARRRSCDQDLLDINGRLDHALESQQQIADQVEQRLREDSGFVKLSDRAAVAEAALERAEANLEEIDQDSAKKLPAYDNSALFRYLQQRGFATQNYKKRGLTRRVDRWLAKLVDYRKAKQGYDFLCKTPEQMRQIIAEDRQALDTVMDELERRRDEVAAGLGLPDKIEQTQQIEEDRKQQLDSFDRMLEQIEQTQHELSELENTRGPYYREAIQLFRDMLESTNSRDLNRTARQTREITDDQIVARLMGVESELDELDDAARRRRSKLDQTQSFLDEFGRLIQRFRAARFDSSRSQFTGSLDIWSELERAQDANNVELLWNGIRDAQRWGPTAIEQVTRVATHPLTQVLVNAMAHAAGGAMGSYARRAGRRRANRDSRWAHKSGESSDSSW